MKKSHKKYSKPRRPFDKARIDEENILREKYGLKTKREIWKADSAIGRVRNQAKKLITAEEEDKKAFVESLKKKGFEVGSIADVLALDKEDWLKRRLQTIVHKKSLANTPNQARQLITHRHVSIGEQVVNKPSYQVSLEEEGLVKSSLVLKSKDDKKGRLEEIKEDIDSSERDKDKREEAEVKKEKPEEIKPIEVVK